ncbi:hypothetical protein DLAC_06888 [Tieghemostelium lacteum]|uniref:Major facilitator superfamily (MFS) profile domain-containing protein n=1 Tax=Tieghemostelium lacteum TaxID=361077 RepID=A0A151ZDM3_TIELA|nr:hypothetical protein DLAC_06888 [Tieghemostelium lacteum]|eukprot:KYQ92053.1 hypothetical protein DLAC_06888 [Tieghemostelium lacteum]
MEEVPKQPKVPPTVDLSIYNGNKRYLLLFLAEIQMLMISGIVFGWEPLQDAMIQQNVFLDLCSKGETSCKAQSLRLNLVYTIGTFTATGSAFVSGYIFDKKGPIWTNIIAFVLMVLGCIVWYVAQYINDNLYILSFALIGTGGPACQVSLLHIANLFPKIQSSISSSFSGMFVGSSFIFKVFSIIAERYHIDIPVIFMYYIAINILLFVPTFFMMDSKPYLPMEEINRLHAISNDNQSINNQHEHQNQNHQNLKEKSAIQQMLSWQFILLCLFMSFNSLHEIFYIGIVNTLFTDQFYIDFFNYSWYCGLFMVPIVGYIMLKSNIYLNSIYVISAGFLFGIVALIPVTKLQPVGFILVSLQNVYLWAFFFVYLSEVFGYNNYGKLMGLSSIVTALIGLLEYLLVYLTLNVLTFFWLNLILTLSKIPLYYFSYKLWKTYKNPKDYLPLNQNDN